jgi:hypothetical protein
MTSRHGTTARSPHVEVRVLLPAEAHQDIAAMARTTGLATSQYIRTLVMTHIAKTYANTEKNP